MKSDNPLAVHGHISYLEMPTVDPRTSVAFYTSLFGWKFRDPDSPSPTFDDGTGQVIGRFHSTRVPSREPGFLPYIYVTDIRDIVARAPAAGGEVIKPPYPEGDLLVATVRDPAGNLIGIWQFTR